LDGAEKSAPARFLGWILLMPLDRGGRRSRSAGGFRRDVAGASLRARRARAISTIAFGALGLAEVSRTSNPEKMRDRSGSLKHIGLVLRGRRYHQGEPHLHLRDEP